MPNELTNPNNVVTEERLAQFYQQILPYLGGMPDILANKFSKADLYSTDEKIIGRWIDGKPLYQKTFNNVSLPSSINANTATVIITDDSLKAVDRLIDCMLIFSTSADGERIDYNARNALTKSTGKLAITVALNSGYTGVSNVCVTIQYTKTTDSAVDIGSDTDYSTTEKIVGTWIDGKPIYQRTFTNVTISATILTGIDTLVTITGMNLTNNNQWYHVSGNSAYTGTFGELINGELKIKAVGSGYTGGQIEHVTIQYTKTSS